MTGSPETNDGRPGADEAPVAPAPVGRGRLVGRAVAATAGIVAVFAVVLVAMLYLLQDRLIYRRTPVAPPPTGWQARELAVPGTGALHAWWKPGRPDRPVILFMHGNATSMAGVDRATTGYAALGYGVLAPEYPGYAGNPGTPGEGTLKAEADAAMDLLPRLGVNPDRIVVVGNSIGAGPAIHAARRPHMALVVVSGVASMEDVARTRVGPLAALVRDRWDNEAAIRSVRGHVVVVHGMSDEVVDFDQGERLAAAARVPLITLPGDHSIAFEPDLQRQIALSVERRGGR